MARQPTQLAKLWHDVQRRVKGRSSGGRWAQVGMCAAQSLLPYRAHFEETPLGFGVTAVEMAKVFFGTQLMTVRAFVVEDPSQGSNGRSSSVHGGTLIDAGLACMAPRLARLAQERDLTQVMITHHHEDHSGGAMALQQAGLHVYASRATAALMAPRKGRATSGLPVRLYQHIMWSQAPSCSHVHALPPTTELPGDDVLYFVVFWVFGGRASW